MKCDVCGSSAVRTHVLPEFTDDLMGIPVVVVDSVQQTVCAKCKEVLGHNIPNLGGLIAACAIKRVSIADKLTGREIRFLRKALGWKAKELASKLDVSPEHVSRWENDAKPMSPQSEKYLRLVVWNVLHERAPRIDCDPERLIEMKIRSVRPIGPRPVMCFELVTEEVEAPLPKEQYKAA